MGCLASVSLPVMFDSRVPHTFALLANVWESPPSFRRRDTLRARRFDALGLIHEHDSTPLLVIRGSGFCSQRRGLESPRNDVIPKRRLVARGICCFAAGKKQIPRR